MLNLLKDGNFDEVQREVPPARRESKGSLISSDETVTLGSILAYLIDLETADDTKDAEDLQIEVSTPLTISVQEDDDGDNDNINDYEEPEEEFDAVENDDSEIEGSKIEGSFADLSGSDQEKIANSYSIDLLAASSIWNEMSEAEKRTTATTFQLTYPAGADSSSENQPEDTTVDTIEKPIKFSTDENNYMQWAKYAHSEVLKRFVSNEVKLSGSPLTFQQVEKGLGISLNKYQDDINTFNACSKPIYKIGDRVGKHTQEFSTISIFSLFVFIELVKRNYDGLPNKSVKPFIQNVQSSLESLLD